MWTVPNWMRISLDCSGELVLCNDIGEWTGLVSNGACVQVGQNGDPKKDTFDGFVFSLNHFY